MLRSRHGRANVFVICIPSRSLLWIQVKDVIIKRMNHFFILFRTCYCNLLDGDASSYARKEHKANQVVPSCGASQLFVFRSIVYHTLVSPVKRPSANPHATSDGSLCTECHLAIALFYLMHFYSRRRGRQTCGEAWKWGGNTGPESV